ncbi:MAG: hypothetical protein AAGU01_09705, partial [Clostridiaceae bacterium]
YLGEGKNESTLISTKYKTVIRRLLTIVIYSCDLETYEINPVLREDSLSKMKKVKRSFLISSGYFFIGKVKAMLAINCVGFNPKIKILIDFDDDLTVEGLKDSWKLINELQLLLDKIQGNRLRYKEELLFHYYELKISGVSYTEIAYMVNRDFLFKVINGVFTDIDFLRYGFFNVATDFLKAMMIKEDEIKIWMKEAITKIRIGEIPWKIEHGPVDRERVIGAIRYFGNKVDENKIIIKDKRILDLHLINYDLKSIHFDNDICETLMEKIRAMENIS